ncbi:desmoglein-2.1-like [Alosa pseudoharengus]|uniref:desmoglein-2.1-like n=1 Tax=Alosa pseudoharengus TaxID=34774 RepID=UPI003F8BEA40
MSAKANSHRRHKREWIIAPTKLEENVDYTKREYIAKIRSDLDEEKRVKYSLNGPGASGPPVNRFIIDPDTGFVKVTEILDREEIHQYNLTGIATFLGGAEAEEAIELTVIVVDQNDNPPKFEIQSGTVRECSTVGTVIMNVTAHDEDLKGTVNSKIAYSIIKQEPPGSGMLFSINRDTGQLFVKEPTLDRETHDYYELTVQGVDMDGAPNGNTATGTVKITLQDINDNVPTLEKEEYAGNVDEGAVDVVVMRIKALDVDLKDSDNWLTIFNIVSGNEGDLFTIHTDPKTNEGILKLVKPVDYEKIKKLNLELELKNVAPFVNGTALALGLGFEWPDQELEAEPGPGTKPGGQPGTKPGGKPGPKPGGKPGPKPSKPGKKPGKSYPISIAVKNMPDGPSFEPGVKDVPLSENPEEIELHSVIAVYPAVDGDTGEDLDDVKYAKGFDPDNWLTIDEDTAEIRLNKMPDRESPFLKNGTYYAEVLCLSQDGSGRTATGTIAINVQDSNDNCPKLTSTYQNICTDSKVVYMSAIDEDFSPNGEPLHFSIISEQTTGPWETEKLNGTAVALHSVEPLWPGVYTITVEVTDAQGLSCPDKQTLELEVCTCTDGYGCSLRGYGGADGSSPSSVSFGAPAIGVVLAGLAVLLVVPLLLLFCQCGSVAGMADRFMDLPFDVKEYLIPYHTEGKGEDKEVPTCLLPVTIKEAAPVALSSAMEQQTTQMSSSTYSQMMQMSQFAPSQHVEMDMRSMAEYEAIGQANTLIAHQRGSTYHAVTWQESRQAGLADLYEDIALPDGLLMEYFTQKSACIAVQVPQKDTLLDYGYEGQGSPAGSVGCSSLLGSDDDLQFLDDLGSEFSTLAQICKPPKLILEQSETSLQAKTERESSMSVSTVKVSEAVPPPSPVHTEPTEICRTISNSSTLPRIQLCEAVAVPTQTVLVQQQQPLYYMVEPQQVQSTVLLAERPQVGLGQGMILVNGSQTVTEGMLLQGGGLVQGAQGLVMAQGGQVLVLQQDGHVQGGQGLVLQQGGHVQGGQGLVLQQGGHIQGGQGLVLQQGGHVQGEQGLVLQQGGHIQGGQGLVLQQGGHVQGGQGLVLQQGGHVQGGHGLVLQQGGHVQGGQGLVLQQGGHVQGGQGLVLQQEGHVQGAQGVIVQGSGTAQANLGQAESLVIPQWGRFQGAQGLVLQQGGHVQGAQGLVLVEQHVGSLQRGSVLGSHSDEMLLCEEIISGPSSPSVHSPSSGSLLRGSR